MILNLSNIERFFILKSIYSIILYIEMNGNKRISSLINEELSKSDVSSMIMNSIDSKMSSKEFEKKVKEISSEVISELFKILWQRNNFWKGAVR